jgi:hypothetical protein
MAKKLNFYKLPIEIAANKYLTHSEKLIAAYLFTLFGNGRDFFGTNAHLAQKLNVQKSSISVCLKKLRELGWINISNPKSNKRRVTIGNNPCASGKFYILYLIVAQSEDITSLEKILLSYILSFLDSGKPFYAKNAKVFEKLNISKEGFNTSRIKFEELKWFWVLSPKSPRRELVLLNHPLENMPTELRRARNNDGLADNDSVNQPDNAKELPINTTDIPENNDNNISNYRSNEKNRITEINNTDFKDTISPSSSVDYVLSYATKVDDTPSISNDENDEEPTSTIAEAHASTTTEVAPPSTEGASPEANASPLNQSNAEATTSTKEGGGSPVPNPNGIGEKGATDSFSAGQRGEDKPFYVKDYLELRPLISLTNYIESLGRARPSGRAYTHSETQDILLHLSKENVDELMARINHKMTGKK